MKTLFLIFISLLCASVSFATPAIISLSGLATNGEIIEIEGEAFGAKGPQVVLFDDFSEGVDGQRASASAIIGEWASMRGFIYQDDALSHGKGLRVVDPSFSNGHAANWIQFGAAYSEIFMSSRAYVPRGYKFPASSNLETMPAISGLKHHWPMYGAQGYGSTGHDLFGPNWTGANWMTISSNKNKTYVYQHWGHPGWEWGKPVRWSHYIKGNGMEPVGSKGFFQGVTSGGQVNVIYNEANMGGKVWFSPFWEPEGMPYAFDRMTIPGYLRSGSVYPEHNYVIDDVYIAVGPNSAARIEIGNKPIYTECTKMAVSTPISWSANKISFTVREGTFKKGESAFLFVVDGNNTPSEGYPIEFGVKYPLPSPPSNLTILH